MVSVEKDNAYQLREHLHRKVVESAHADPFKACFLHFLGLSKDAPSSFDFPALSLYHRCAISGLGVLNETVSSPDVSRLLGQAAKIDSTPRPWVSDVFGVMAVKWLVGRMNDARIAREFERTSRLSERATRALKVLLRAREAQLQGTAQMLGVLSYRSVLARGYALVRDANGLTLRKASSVMPGAHLTLEFADGKVDVTAHGESAASARPRPGSARVRPGSPDQGKLF